MHNAIQNVFNDKFSKNDEIVNKIIVLLFKKIKLTSMLRKFFQMCLNNEYCFEYFRRLMTMFLKKLNKSNYNDSKTYRSIVLFCIIENFFESIMTNKLTWTIKTNKLFFNLHMKNRKNISSKTTIHIIMKRIYTIWNEKKKKKNYFFLTCRKRSITFRTKKWFMICAKKKKQKIVCWIELKIS